MIDDKSPSRSLPDRDLHWKWGKCGKVREILFTPVNTEPAEGRREAVTWWHGMHGNDV